MSERELTLHEQYRDDPDKCATFGEYVVKHYAKAECIAEHFIDGAWQAVGDFDGCSVGYVVGIFDDIAKEKRLASPARIRLVKYNGIVVKAYGAS